MIYKDFQDISLSALGMGTMRLPVIDGHDSKINETEAEKMIDAAMEGGVNYYDTAWGYHGENSELVVGKALSKYPRDSFYLATKFPGYDVKNFGKVEEIFEKQLEKCRVDYFDFYLFHNVCEINIDQYLDDEKYGTYSYLIEQKRNGRIKHLGCSGHGEIPVMKAFLDKYGDDIEFCQLQINYFDWTFQHAKEKVEMLKEYGIPVWVMEPMRGGKLADLDEKYVERLKALRPDATPEEWALRFLQSVPEIQLVLTGASSMEQLQENIRIFSEDKPLSDEEMDTLLSVASDMISDAGVPCTECHYCVSHCPQGLDIPMLLRNYNQFMHTGKDDFISHMQISTLPEDKRPAACIACHSCEQVCPQHIKIPDVLADFAEKL
ncbi:MAG: aldo/keto reductase [Anaerovoracaceae bacterium]|jgi:predicted aldo/keto reductase-like oxidoreductase